MLKIISPLLLFTCLFCYSCSKEDFSTASYNSEEKTYSQLGKTNFTAKENIFYALSVLTRIEEQLIKNPTRSHIDDSLFSFSMAMFKRTKDTSYNEYKINTREILDICNSNKVFCKNPFSDSELNKRRKDILYNTLAVLSFSNTQDLYSILNYYIQEYQSFIQKNKGALKGSINIPKAKTRVSGVEYRITLKTPNGDYKISCDNDTYILDAAEEQGIDLPYSSRCGADFISAAKLISGTVYMPDNQLLDYELLSQGYILLDIAYPASDCVIQTNMYNMLGEIVCTPDVSENEFDDLDHMDKDHDISDHHHKEIDRSEDQGGGGNNDSYNDYEHLTQKEKDFIRNHPIAAYKFRNNANKAVSMAIEFCKANGYDISSLHNGIGDCYRHMLWSAYNCYDEGEILAKEYGDAHESDPLSPKDERRMDLFNNKLGYELGNKARNEGFSKDDIPNLVGQAIKGGKGITL